MKTFASVLDASRNVGPGFAFLRVFVALCIVYLHSWTVSDQYFAPTNWDNTPVWMLHFAVVPVFFAISGFLTSASAGRLTLKNFAINRAMRIIPALSAVTIICALVIGPLLTSVSLHEYFHSRQFATYFLNMLGWVHYFLPGVFSNHAVSEVNGSLWTVPFEFGCYGLIACLIVLGLMKSKFAALALVTAYMLVSVLVGATGLVGRIHFHGLGKVVSVAFLEHEASAVSAFILGIAAYQLRHHIVYSRWIFVASVTAMTVIAFAFPSMTAGLAPVLRFVLVPAIVYITVFLGLTKLPLPKFFHTGDYSYGIYLYHQPLLQIIITLLPSLALAPRTGPLFTFIASLPFSIGAAWLSWHLIEKRLLAWRKTFVAASPARAEMPHAGQAQPSPLATQNVLEQGIEIIGRQELFQWRNRLM